MDALTWRGLTRRGALGGGLGLAAALGLAACGGSDGADGADGTAPAGSASAGAGFPVTVRHAFGSTEIPAAPQRVVSAGATQQDVLLALGVVPVGITDWYGDQPFGTWPWAQDALGDATPTLLSADDGFQLEKIAALTPDLIVATNDGMTKADFDKLSAIAPTLPHSGDYGDYAEPWSVQTESIGTALGLRTEARQVVVDVMKTFADARAAHPAFEGTKVVLLQNAVYDGSVIAYQDGFSTEFLTDLGLVVLPGLDKFAQDAQAYIPLEQLSVLDGADLLIWATEKPEDEDKLHQVPGFDQLTAVREGRSLYTGGTLSGAIYFSTVLSLPYVVDTLVPMIDDVL
jgi:iron complex transport system substrate-binding protein